MPMFQSRVCAALALALGALAESPTAVPTGAPTSMPSGLRTVQPVLLGTAVDFAVLAKAGISTVPQSSITGDVGVSPIAGSALTGFSLTADSTDTFATSTQVTGKMYAANYGGSTPAKMTTAVGDMETAYTDAASRPSSTPDASFLNRGGSAGIGGETLAAGVYSWTGNIGIAADIYIDAAGDSGAVFIFQTTGDVLVAAGVEIKLLNGAKAKNIFWQVAGFVEAGASAHLEGVFLVKTKAVFKTGSSINGRLLAQTAVTLQSATVTAPTVGPHLAAALTASAETGSSYLADDDDDDDDEHDLKTIFGMLVAILAVLALLVVLQVASLVQGCSAGKIARGGSKGGGGPAKADSDDVPQSPMH